MLTLMDRRVLDRKNDLIGYCRRIDEIDRLIEYGDKSINANGDYTNSPHARETSRLYL